MRKKKHTMTILLKILLILAAAGILCFSGILAFLVVQENRTGKDVAAVKDYDAIIVLGAQVREDGTPSIQLGLRLDMAAEAWQQKNVPMVVCGAQGADEPMPEADAMRIYLTEKGIPAEQILTDPASFNTSENLRNAGRLLQEKEQVEKVLIVSSDYHVPRAMALAKDQGFEAEGLGSPCKQEYWIKNHFRETLAWVKYWMVKYLHVSL